MRLAEALQIVARDTGGEKRQVRLLCGFEPLHFATFVRAYLRQRFPGDAISVRVGLYGDLEGNIQRASQEGPAEGAIAVVEWSDLDARLGFRNSGRRTANALDDVASQVEERCNRLLEHIKVLAAVMPVTIIGPTLPLPPISHLPPAQASSFELQLEAILLLFLRHVSQITGVKVLSASALAMISPSSTRHDIKMDLQTGFPYTLIHTDVVAQLAVSCLFPTSPKKGLITDLDNTLWKGILGDIGAERISWSLEDKSQVHALYQQVLASLAESGVLIAIASKNDPQLVNVALSRPDLLLAHKRIFPIEASWEIKSDAIGRILSAWNIDADSAVFVDDSLMELAEVSEKFPRMECLQFPSDDPAGILALLRQLRVKFGKEEVGQEDHLRADSLRAAASARSQGGLETSENFISRLDAKVTFETSDAENTRALELVNKTNQFNLNGRRYTAAEWKLLSKRAGCVLLVVSYEDRFGPLGRIGVLSGYESDDKFFVDTWVMSCRAFSRQIEYETLKFLFAKLKVAEVTFCFTETERNRPLQKMFESLLSTEKLKQGDLKLSAHAFRQSCPTLFHEVIDKWTKSEPN